MRETATAPTEFQDKIEALIDRTTLYDVLEAIATICDAKAEHLESHWQDEKSAAVWAQAARQINKLIKHSHVIGSI